METKTESAMHENYTLAAMLEKAEAERDAALSVQKQLVEALEISEAYILAAANKDGGIDECDIGFRIDLESIRAAIQAAKASS